ncbi:hypothetical protein SD77_2596 [Bacillus badius]|uniref:Mobile element protein n=1 Tax=Bacillus badius TaxID=1455 RepID=A0ABR5AZK4_BACBA|nr:hypothetical protein SD78_1948 [Bacillus badius]KIL80142.1 hypothetical protein SD77_2596 [Bacillus badius]
MGYYYNFNIIYLKEVSLRLYFELKVDDGIEGLKKAIK